MTDQDGCARPLHRHAELKYGDKPCRACSYDDRTGCIEVEFLSGGEPQTLPLSTLVWNLDVKDARLGPPMHFLTQNNERLDLAGLWKVTQSPKIGDMSEGYIWMHIYIYKLLVLLV